MNFCVLILLINLVNTKPYVVAEDKNNSECIPEHGTNRFHWIDYTVVGIMLIVSCGIGTFYGFFGKKQKTSADFLLGGRGMGTIPMAMSLAAGFITAIELLGNPKEMYVYGTMFWLQCFAYLLVVPIASYLYLPVFMKLQLTSSFEYLETRFNMYTRIIAAAMYAFQMILYTSVAVYAPALALSHVTGLNVYIAVSLVYLVCIFYASQGGMKAVIMADTFQAIVLVLSVIIILILGNNLVGGFSNVIKSNAETQRIEFFIFDFDPKVRHSVWSVIIGGTFYWATMFCSNQASIQKYMTVETLSQARSALWISSISLVLILSINFYTGMIMFTEYKGCDPVLNKEICDSDQLLPLFVMKSLGSYRGVPGLFVAGIFAASLGTVASALNSLAAITMKDFFSSLCGFNVPENKGSIYSKWISVFYGVLGYFLVFVVEQLGSLLQVALSFNGMAGGVTLGLFSLGMFIPWANSKGALVGSITAAGFVLWICFGAQIAIANGYEPAPPKELFIYNCSNVTFNEFYKPIILSESNTSNDEIWSIYKISYLWYSVIGFFITMIIGIIVSIFTGPEDPCRIHPDLISPPVQHILKKLPNHLKEMLSIPLESKTTERPNTDKHISSPEVGGIVNQSINLENDVVK